MAVPVSKFGLGLEGITVSHWVCSEVMIMLLVLTIIHLFCFTGGTIQVYVKTGESLTLDLTNADVPKEFEMLTFLYNSSSVLGIFSPGREPAMTSRAVFSSAESVTLKHLQKSDSGEYSIKVTENKDYTLPTYYTVTVQGGFSFIFKICTLQRTEQLDSDVLQCF